jgi:hypothetical protein
MRLEGKAPKSRKDIHLVNELPRERWFTLERVYKAGGKLYVKVKNGENNESVWYGLWGDYSEKAEEGWEAFVSNTSSITRPRGHKVPLVVFRPVRPVVVLEGTNAFGETPDK